jgi:ribosomal protein S18 acetylase RimI-like enzyme
MTTIRITPFELTDYDAAVALWRESEGIVLGRADERDAIARFLAHNAGLSFVARHEGALVGAALCGSDGRRGFLHHVAVAAPHRRQGVARALVERCLDGLRHRGVGKCHVFVLGANDDAQRFWEREGWARRGDLVLMSRELA